MLKLLYIDGILEYETMSIYHNILHGNVIDTNHVAANGLPTKCDMQHIMVSKLSIECDKIVPDFTLKK